ncbi:MAG: hypothetical protein HYX68_00605 [Planctomycetes bacterium]|nr:hypothetical protein [Planctomycetota bacterium]
MYNTVDEIAKDGGKKIGKPGRHAGIRTVKSEADLEAIWIQYSQGGAPVAGSTYPGPRVEFADGSEIAKRPSSKSGGPTIDVLGVAGERVKIRVDPWPPVLPGATP